VYRLRVLEITLALTVVAGAARADSIWSRADPSTAFLFQSYKAHRVGDLLTIVVDENTGFEGMEQRQLSKQTQNAYTLKLSANGTVGQRPTQQINGAFDGSGNSNRSFQSQNNSTIDRKFTDKMTVTVVGVLPNGNLVVEGFRQRIVAREIRTLHVTGVVRQGDIGPSNTVNSAFVGNFVVRYFGRGPESSYYQHGWWNSILNVIWPW
jgi:flagellar L-ring protein precursor FlgH